MLCSALAALLSRFSPHLAPFCSSGVVFLDLHDVLIGCLASRIHLQNLHTDNESTLAHLLQPVILEIVALNDVLGEVVPDRTLLRAAHEQGELYREAFSPNNLELENS